MNPTITTKPILAPPVAAPEEVPGVLPRARAPIAEEFDEFVIGQGWARIYRSAKDVDPAIWQAAFGDSRKDFEYYRLIEETMTSGFIYRYLLLLDERHDPVALQPLIVVDQDLALTAGPALERAILVIRKLWPRFLRSRILLAGCLVGNDRPGVIAPANPTRVSALLAEALLAYAGREKISLITGKDFPATLRDELSPLIAAKFTRFGGFPPLMLELNFKSFDEYMQKLSRPTRKSLRRKFRKTENSSPPITLEVLSDCNEVIDEIYPLYFQVAHRAPVEFEIFSREYFIEAGKRMPDRHRYFVWRRGGKAIAFSFCTIWKNAIYDNDIGLDYDVAHDLSLYHRTFHDVIVWALEQGLKEYHCAPFNYDPKSHLRLQLIPVDLYVRHTSPLFNSVLKRVAPHFAPAKSDPALRNYPEHAKS